MSDQYTTDQNKQYKGTLVDSSFTDKDKGEEPVRNYPEYDDTTQEGGYGGTGDPFTRRNQAHYDRGQFGRGQYTPAMEPASRDEQYTEPAENAGEGYVPENEASAAQVSSSGTAASGQQKLNRKEMNADEIGA